MKLYNGLFPYSHKNQSPIEMIEFVYFLKKYLTKHVNNFFVEIQEIFYRFLRFLKVYGMNYDYH